LEFSASVGFIDKEDITMHGYTIVKFIAAKQAKDKLLYQNTKEN
jgi:hypothetical protein